MDQLPWHPVLVHFPIVLSILLPLLTLALWFLLRGTGANKRIWLLIPLVASMHFGFAIAAKHYGEIDGQRIGQRISDDAYEALEAHEVGGAKVPVIAAFVLLSAFIMYFSLKRYPWAPLVFVVISALGAVPVLQVGHSGGKLIYEHGLSEVKDR